MDLERKESCACWGQAEEDGFLLFFPEFWQGSQASFTVIGLDILNLAPAAINHLAEE